ncbi:pentapeptide repeat-containing protein [Streptomyces tibetensis]|uniref:pentapeptide repeat-containing protein n=1 Tax=Streptomyces tibetensis TaxID=2382123 RepID=UPI0033CCC9F5
MQDSPRDQPRTVSVLSAYVRRHARVPPNGFAKEKGTLEEREEIKPSTDVQAVMNVLADRSHGHDGRAQLDWSDSDLRGLELSPWAAKELQRVKESEETPKGRVSFAFANFAGADLRYAGLYGIDLQNASFIQANLSKKPSAYRSAGLTSRTRFLFG